MDASAETGNSAALHRAAARDLADLYTRHGPNIQRFAYVLTGDSRLAEDLTQDAFARLWANFFRVQNRAGHSAYVRRTVLNLARGHARRARIERRYLSKEAGRARVSAETTVLDVEEREALWARLHELPLRQRAAIVLRYYEDLTEFQTAEIMNCSPSAVKSLVARAVRSLRKTVYADEEGLRDD